MPAKRKVSSVSAQSSATIGFEAKLWLTAGSEKLSGNPFEEKIPRIIAELAAQFAKPDQLETAIRANLKGFDYAL